ncbi:MAG: hypothetical protein ACF8XB_10115 [Planctomycetota bacterium JB042]
MIDGRWKLRRDRDGRVSPYDLDADGCETVDLASRPPERVEALLAEHARWAERNHVLPKEVVERARPERHPSSDDGDAD